jgi:chromosome segregation ATPase
MGEQKKPQPQQQHPKPSPAVAQAKAAQPAPAAPAAKEAKKEEVKGYADIDGDGVLDEVLINPAAAQEKHQRRIALLNRNQDLTKESMDIEVEIRRLENLQTELLNKLKGLKDKKDFLEKNKGKIHSDVDEAEKDVARLREETEKLTARRAQLEEEVGRRRKERSEHIGAISTFKSEKEGLIF